MTTARAVRDSLSTYESFLTYYTCNNNEKSASSIRLKESTFMVDGIGGGVWEGAIVMSNLMESILLAEHSVIELGCGAGLSGIISTLTGAKVMLTDRISDLVRENISLLKEQLCNEMHFDNLYGTVDPRPSISSCELTWNDSSSQREILCAWGTADFIIGAEIACLRKQQANLTMTIDALSGPQTVVLISFDDIPMPSNEDLLSSSSSLGSNETNPSAERVSKYELEMDEKMRSKGYKRAVICSATVTWHKMPSTNSLESDCVQQNVRPQDESNELLVSQNQTSTSAYAVVHEITRMHYNDLQVIQFPPLVNQSCLKIINQSSASYSKSTISAHTHHITAYYRQSATSVCSRCLNQYFTVLRNSDRSCRHHASNYVCRYHPAELRLSINGGGDFLGYYGNGKEGWDAKFWDCCGSEDQNAPGCVWSRHSDYG